MVSLAEKLGTENTTKLLTQQILDLLADEHHEVRYNMCQVSRIHS